MKIRIKWYFHFDEKKKKICIKWVKQVRRIKGIMNLPAYPSVTKKVYGIEFFCWCIYVELTKTEKL